MGYPFLKDV